jgi:hypothetical protein
MLSSAMRRVVAVAAVASVAVIATGVEPAAAEDFPAGIACPFPVHTDLVINQKFHEFTDANGNAVVRVTGLGGITVTNTDTGASRTLSEAGQFKVVTTSDGPTTTVTVSGHLLLILFPTDVPAGPSTTAYVGRVVFTIDNLTGAFTLQETRGTATDICAALSG